MASTPAAGAQPPQTMVDSTDTSAKHIRDIKLAIEFKYMMKHAPGGVFLMPTLDNNRELHGVIFLRRGLYRNGVFRFKVLLPNAYNSINSHPIITFTSPVFNPLIHPEV
jgi:ubiquitin-protein ligase